MSGKRSRTKGHSFEREVAKMFRPYFPDARRGLQYRDGSECCDVEGTYFNVECKRHKKVRIEKEFLNMKIVFRPYQADDGTTGVEMLPPLLISKSDQGPILVTMEWGTFEEYLKCLMG